ncbi:MAG: adenylate kinase family protein [Candidatus Woesearchaeota archaeon]
MERIILFGPPGAGKGTVSELLSNYDFFHISPGDIFRKELDEETDLGKELNKYMSKGELVPDKLVDKVIFNYVEKYKDKKLDFDGFPRTVKQLKELEKRYPIDKVLVLEVNDETIIERLSKRRVCPNCGRTYHLITKKPKNEGICDNCGHKLIHRKDDKPETIQNRLDQYNENTIPVLKEYKKLGKEIITIDAEKSIEEVLNQVKIKLNLD